MALFARFNERSEVMTIFLPTYTPLNQMQLHADFILDLPGQSLRSISDTFTIP